MTWTSKTRAKLTVALSNLDWKVSSTTVSRLRNEIGYTAIGPQESRRDITHRPERSVQVDRYEGRYDFLQRGQPTVWVDTKKRERVGEFKNSDREWQPKRSPEKSPDDDFPRYAAVKAIPYGIYGMVCSETA